MDKNANALNWFEVPAADINRARKFYEQVFSTQMEEPNEMMGMWMCFFPAGQDKVGGALVQGPMHTPSTTGSIVYLNANPSLQAVVDRVEPAGGRVTMPATKISDEIGYMAFFIDSEGNAMALHANKP